MPIYANAGSEFLFCNSERVTIFSADDLFVPNRMCQLMSVPDIEGAVGTQGRARSQLQIHDVDAVGAHTLLYVIVGIGRWYVFGFQPSQHPPADQLHHRRDLDVLVLIENIAWPHTVEKDVSGELLPVRRLRWL